MPSFNMPVVLDCPIAIASIKTVGILFIMEDKNADIKPMPITLLNNPRLEILDNTSAKIVVIPTFFNPNTTKYIPMENKTIFHGAPLMTCFV